MGGALLVTADWLGPSITAVAAHRLEPVDSGTCRSSLWWTPQSGVANHQRRNATVKYALLIYTDYQGAGAPANQPAEAVHEMYAAYGRFTEELVAAGKLGSAAELANPAEAKSVRVKDGRSIVTDGPFAEVREQLGGLYIIDADDMHEAVAWAAKVPSAPFGTIEVRPLAPPMMPPEA